MNEETYRILVADDDPPILELLGEYLSTRGHEVTLVPDGERALDALAKGGIDVLVTDMKMPGTDGLSLLRHVRENNLPVATIMMTGYGTIESAISALKSGAHNYLLKPFRLREVHSSVSQAVEARRVEQATLRLEHLVEIQEAALGITSPRDLDELYRLVVDRCCDELKADAVSLAFFEPVGQRWVEYQRGGSPSAFQGIDLDAISEFAQREEQPFWTDACWFNAPKHLLTTSIKGSIEQGPGRTIGMLSASGASSTLPNPERILQVYGGILGQSVSNQILLQRHVPNPSIGRVEGANSWNSQMEEDLLRCAQALQMSPSESNACSWALRLRTNEGFQLRDLIEGGMLDVVTMGGGGLPMSTVEKLIPILKTLDERPDGNGSPGVPLDPSDGIQKPGTLGAAFSHWIWLTQQRYFAHRMDLPEACTAMDNCANTSLNEAAVNAIVETLGGA